MSTADLLERLRQDTIRRAMGKGADTLSDLAETDFNYLTGKLALALEDERAHQALKAELALDKFRVEARSWLEAVEWRDALVDTLLAIAASALSAGIKVAASSLADALKK